MILSLPYRILMYVGLILACVGFGYVKGLQHDETKHLKESVAAAGQTVKYIKGQNIITDRVVTQVVTKTQVVYKQAAAITKEVPVYVTAQNDQHCAINNGFVRVWNASNTGEALPATPEPADAADSPVKLSDVAQQHNAEAALCRANEEIAIGLQDWIRDQQNHATMQTTPPR